MRLQRSRILVQALALILLHSSWGLQFKWLCNPVLSCHSCSLAFFTCPIGVFIHYAGWILVPFIALGTVLYVGVLFGRLLCGWVCPFGFLQDLLYRIRTPKFTLPRWTRVIKYAVLFLMVLLFPLLWGEQTALSFCRVCPASALQVTVPNIVAGTGSFSIGVGVKLGVLLAVLVLVVFSSRAFCSVLCPIGAMLAPFNHLSFWSVKPPTTACIACKSCDRKCPTAVNPSARIVGGVSPSRDLDCVVCHRCQPVCPVGDNRKPARKNPAERREAEQPAPPGA